MNRDSWPMRAAPRFVLIAVIGLTLGAVSASAMPPLWIEAEDYRGWKTIHLDNGLVSLEIVPEIGGRLTQFRLGAKEFLWVNPQLAGKLPPESGLGPDGGWLNYGGDKLWPAPQGWDDEQQWPGPPDAVLDGQPYRAEALDGGTAVQLTSRDDPRSGKGFAGNHGAGDNWHDWPEGLEMIGCKFVCHPYGRIQIKVDDPQSPLTKVFDGQPFPFQDEIYAFTEPYSRAKLRVLLSIDYPNSPDVVKAEENLKKRAAAPDAKPSDKQFVAAARDDHDYAIAWIRPWGQGRVFYCSLGHRNEVTWDPAIVRFNLAGIQYALGDLKVDDRPLAK